jgi:hypothetical protein
MKNIIFIVVLMLPSLIFGQQISLNKDSLSITNDLPNGYTGTVEYTYLDSLWIKNVGQEVLIIDSIKTENTYSYRTKIIYQDSIEYSILYNYEGTITLEILPQDSIKVIFADPDLCPICDTSILDNFTDKFYIYSNSINNEVFEVDVSGVGLSTGVQEETAPSSFQLYQNYPNPFNPTTNIKFSIKGNHRVRIIITNTLGEFVAELVNGRYYEGDYEIKFNGEKLSSGVYYYSLIIDNQIRTKKLMLIK